MQTILTLPIRFSLIVAVVALVGISSTRILQTVHTDPLSATKTASHTAPAADDSSDTNSPKGFEWSAIPPVLFLPLALAGGLLLLWHVAELRQVTRATRR